MAERKDADIRSDRKYRRSDARDRINDRDCRRYGELRTDRICYG